jgi:polysaccharide biosynthesis protein PslG
VHVGAAVALRARLIVPAVATALLLLSAPPAGAVSREFFGVVPVGGPSAAEFQTMGAAKVGTYRFQLDWSKVQPQEGGAYDWSATDALVRNAARNGIEVLPFVYGTPSYAASNPREPPLGSEEDKQAWKRFLVAAVERYGPGGEFWLTFTALNPGVEPRPIKAWQILNEQNSPTYYKPRPSPKEYGELLKISDEAIGSVDPGADIVLGGMFGTPARNKAIYSWKFLKRLYKKGAENHFDAVALHPYSPNLYGIRAQIKLVRKQTKKAGDGKAPIWITELGWGSAGANGSDLIKSPAGQKKLLRKSFDLLLDRRGRWKIRRVLWFAWRDPDNPADAAGSTCTWCASAGLLEQDLDPKPSFDQFRKFTGAG